MSCEDDRDLELKTIKEINNEKFFVSTIKMKVRHSWLNQHLNVSVFETMIFKKEAGQVQYDNSIFNKRYTTYDNAVEGHEHIIKNIKNIVENTKEYKEKIN